MKRYMISTWVIAFGVVATLCPRQAYAQASDAVAEGSRVYGNTCGSCHNARSPLERTDQQWITVVNHMRVRANMTGRQTRAVLAFLQASNGDPGSNVAQAQSVATFSDAVSSDPAMVQRGEELMALKACIGCHVVAGEGGNVGPSLNGVIENRGPQFVRAKLTNPTFNNSTSMMPNFGLTAPEIDALVAYLASVRSGGGQER